MSFAYLNSVINLLEGKITEYLGIKNGKYVFEANSKKCYRHRKSPRAIRGCPCTCSSLNYAWTTRKDMTCLNYMIRNHDQDPREGNGIFIV